MSDPTSLALLCDARARDAARTAKEKSAARELMLARQNLTAATIRAEKAEAERDALQEALARIVQWSDAYPDDVFPEPDFRKASEVLQAAGMTLDSISASNMRHAIKGAGDIARAALTKGGEQ